MADLWYPEILHNTEAFPASIFFTFFERNSTKDSAMVDTIHLYMPEDFGQPNTVSWDTFQGGQAVVSAASNALGGLQNVAQSVAKETASNAKFSAGASAVGSISGFGRNMLDFLSGGPTNDLIQINQGVMPNPYLAQIFRGVDFRNFSFTFRLVPFSERDCDTIFDIIKTFRKWSLPSGPAGGAMSPYLNYPGEVSIEYSWMGATNQYIHRFKRCVITSLDVNYTGSGMWSMMRNGFPAETVLHMTMSEIQIVVRDDIDEGF